MIGYYLFSQQSFIEKLMKYKGFIITVFIITSAMNVILCQYFISLTGIGCIYNFVLSFVISVIITCGMCFTFCGGKIIFEVK